MSEVSGVAIGKVEFDPISGWIFHEELNLSCTRHRTPSKLYSVLKQSCLHLRKPGARERNVVEGASLHVLNDVRIFDQVQDSLLTQVQPVPRKVEGRSPSLIHSNDFDVERPKLRGRIFVSPKVEVIECNGWHDFIQLVD